MDTLSEGTLRPTNIPTKSEIQLRRYGEILARWSTERTRLTGPKDHTIIWNDHITDCIHALPHLPPRGTVVDVGSGGGLPGIVWAICRPDLQITLVESQRWKTEALKGMVLELDLKNVQIRRCRSEELAEEHRESFDLATARGVSKIGVVAEYLAPLIQIEGSLLAFKGPKYQMELDVVGDRWDRLGLAPPTTFPYRNGDRDGVFVIFKKTKPCPRTYPRRPGRATKKHWWEAK